MRALRRPELAVGAGPPMSGLVMDVIRVEECNQHMDIQQRRPAHSSSRSRLTSSIVGRDSVGARRTSSGTPFRTCSVVEPPNA